MYIRAAGGLSEYSFKLTPHRYTHLKTKVFLQYIFCRYSADNFCAMANLPIGLWLSVGSWYCPVSPGSQVTAALLTLFYSGFFTTLFFRPATIFPPQHPYLRRLHFVYIKWLILRCSAGFLVGNLQTTVLFKFTVHKCTNLDIISASVW